MATLYQLATLFIPQKSSIYDRRVASGKIIKDDILNAYFVYVSVQNSKKSIIYKIVNVFLLKKGVNVNNNYYICRACLYYELICPALYVEGCGEAVFFLI